MKYLFSLLFSMLLLGNMFTSCTSNDVNTPELTEDTYPRIFGQWPEKKNNGDLGEI